MTMWTIYYIHFNLVYICYSTLVKNTQHNENLISSKMVLVDEQSPSLRLFINRFISFTRSIVRSFIYSFVHAIFWFERSFDHFLVQSFIRSFGCSFFRLFSSFFVRSFIRSIAWCTVGSSFCHSMFPPVHPSIIRFVLWFISVVHLLVLCFIRLFFCSFVHLFDRSVDSSSFH